MSDSKLEQQIAAVQAQIERLTAQGFPDDAPLMVKARHILASLQAQQTT